MEFNLLAQPWLCVKTCEGEVTDYSLLDCFSQAHRISGFVHANPLVIASWQRLMLAVLHRVYPARKKKQWLKLFNEGEFGDEVVGYLLSQQDKFDLFSPSHPFFQIPNLTKDKANSVKKLSPDFATANNKTLFSHMADHQQYSLVASDAASYLLVCQYFSLGGGISGSTNIFGKHANYTNAPLVGGAVVYAKGSNLFQSLLLNFHKPPKFDDQEDFPVWEQTPPAKLQPRVCNGMADYFTWPVRYLRLLPDEGGNVAELYIAQGLPNPVEVTEPFFAFKRKKDGGQYPMSLRFGRALWRDSAAIFYRSAVDIEQKNDLRPQSIINISNFAEHLQRQENLSLSCDVIALENNKANPIAWFHQRLPLNISCTLDDDGNTESYAALLSTAVSVAEQSFSTLKKALRSYVAECLPDGARQEDISTAVEAYHLDKYYWPKRDEAFMPFFQTLIAAKEDAIADVMRTWRSQCLRDVNTVFNDIMLLNIQGSGREYQAYAKARDTLESNYIFASKQEVTVTKNVNDFIGYLKRLSSEANPNREALAHLRRALSDEPSAQISAMPYVAEYLPKGEWPMRVYILVAALYASHEDYKPTKENLGASLAKLVKPGETLSNSLSLRVKTMLEADDESLLSNLRSLFQLLKAQSIHVDYIELTHDLLNWHHLKRTTQLRWAHSFWGNPKKPKTNTTNQQGE